MKFLIALSVLASTSVFAQGMDRDTLIKCYDTAQGNDMEVVYKLKAKHNWLKVVYPFEQPLALNPYSHCLEYPSVTGNEEFSPRLSLCRGEGQRINGLVPIEAEYGQEEETVYCEKKILKYFRNHSTEM